MFFIGSSMLWRIWTKLNTCIFHLSETNTGVVSYRKTSTETKMGGGGGRGARLRQNQHLGRKWEMNYLLFLTHARINTVFNFLPRGNTSLTFSILILADYLRNVNSVTRNTAGYATSNTSVSSMPFSITILAQSEIQEQYTMGSQLPKCGIFLLFLASYKQTFNLRRYQYNEF